MLSAQRSSRTRSDFRQIYWREAAPRDDKMGSPDSSRCYPRRAGSFRLRHHHDLTDKINGAPSERIRRCAFCYKIDGYINTHAEQSKVVSGFNKQNYPAHGQRNQQNGGKDINNLISRALLIFEQQQAFECRRAVHRLDGQEIENAIPALRAASFKALGYTRANGKAASETIKFAAGPARAQTPHGGNRGTILPALSSCRTRRELSHRAARSRGSRAKYAPLHAKHSKEKQAAPFRFCRA